MRIVAFHLNFMRFQMGVQRSRSMRLPGLGALGCISTEGFSFVVVLHAITVTTTTTASEPKITAIASHHEKPRYSSGRKYIVAYAFQNMVGIIEKPSSMPTTTPIRQASVQ